MSHQDDGPLPDYFTDTPPRPSRPRPRTWDDGPPQTDIEGWVHGRKNQVVSVAASVIQSLLLAHFKTFADREDWKPDLGEDALNKIADDSWKIAKRIVENSDRDYPRPIA